MLFDRGVPSEYTDSRKADLLIENLKKLVAPDVSVRVRFIDQKSLRPLALIFHCLSGLEWMSH
jgi:hypothetical protein